MKIGVFVGLTLFAAVAPAVVRSQPPKPSASPAGQRANERGSAQQQPGQDKNGDREDLDLRSSSRTYYNLGVEYLLAGKAEEAVNAFKRAIQLNSKDGDAYFNLGNARAYQGRWADAADAYRQALRLRERDAEAHNNLGRAYYQLGRYAEAVESLKRASRIHPTWAEPRYLLSDTYYKLGQLQDASKLYDQGIALNPNHAARQTALFSGKAAAEGRGGATATASPTAAVTRPPAAGAAEPAISVETRTANGERPSTAKSAREAEKVKQNDAKVYYRLGVKHGRAKRYDEAIQAFRQAIQFWPDYADAYFGLGHAYADAGLWQKAVEAYRQVLRLDPKDDEAIYHLGAAYSKLPAQNNSASADRPSTPIGEQVGVAGATTTTDPPAVAASSALRTVPDAAPAGNATSPESSARPIDSDAAQTGESEPTLPPADAPSGSSPAVEPHPTTIYRVGPGDVLDVRLLSAPANQSTLYTVTAGGLLEYPLAGDPLPVAGATSEEIGARVAAELKRRSIHENPEVIVGVREYASHNVIVSGLVNDPGTKVLRREAVPLYVVIADAQPRPDAEEAQIVSVAGQKATVSLGDSAALNLLVRPGDVITVQKSPQQFFYIGGLVGAPGQKPFREGLTLTQAILSSGGELARGGTVNLLRQDEKGFLTTASYKLKSLTSGKEPDPPIRPNDRIEVLQ